MKSGCSPSSSWKYISFNQAWISPRVSLLFYPKLAQLWSYKEYESNLSSTFLSDDLICIIYLTFLKVFEKSKKFDRFLNLLSIISAKSYISSNFKITSWQWNDIWLSYEDNLVFPSISSYFFRSSSRVTVWHVLAIVHRGI